jgi:adenine/guanine phosphoribosyltransferase-like PRPP-binding protein
MVFTVEVVAEATGFVSEVTAVAAAEVTGFITAVAVAEIVGFASEVAAAVETAELETGDFTLLLICQAIVK